jgi:hypothetical protein
MEAVCEVTIHISHHHGLFLGLATGLALATESTLQMAAWHACNVGPGGGGEVAEIALLLVDEKRVLRSVQHFNGGQFKLISFPFRQHDPHFTTLYKVRVPYCPSAPCQKKGLKRNFKRENNSVLLWQKLRR